MNSLFSEWLLEQLDTPVQEMLLAAVFYFIQKLIQKKKNQSPTCEV